MSNDIKNFIGIVIGCTLALFALWCLIFGTWIIRNQIDDSPRVDAQQALYANCKKQFEAGVVSNACVRIVKP